MGFDFAKLSEQLKGIVELLDFFLNSGMERFEYNVLNRYHLTIYKAGAIIRIDLKPIQQDKKQDTENGGE